MELVERLHQRFQGAGTNTPVQSDGEAGGISAVSPAAVVAIGNAGVWSRSCAANLRRLGKMGDGETVRRCRITRIPPNAGLMARRLLVLNSSAPAPLLDGLAEP